MRFDSPAPRALALLLAFTAAACGDEEPAPLLTPDAGVSDGGALDGGADPDAGAPQDPTDVVFAPDHLIEVDIELPPADWDTLRNQARTLDDLFGDSLCIDSPPDSPYTYFPARVTIDGQTFEDVGVRKKGFFGSVNPEKPSLKFKLDKYVSGQRFSDFKRMTFNNGRQGNERSTIHQCIGYRLFAAAGLAAPRCNHARISVNGEALGVFVHVENIKKAFLRRHFDDDEGALYEGALSDFRPVYIDTFERKTNEEIVDRSDLEAVAAALELDDDALLPALGAIVDIDAFITFWAMEALVQHWDGYTGFNNNNFFIYNDPDTGHFHFIPWGVDSILGFGPEGGPPSGFLWSLLARRLHEHPETRDLIYVRLQELLSTVWDEDELLAEVQRAELLVRPHLAPANVALFDQGLVGLRDFVRRRRAEVEALLAGPRPTAPPIRAPLCLEPVGEISGTFEAEWGTFPTNNPFNFGSGTFTATISIQPYVGERVAATAGLNEDGLAIVQVPALFADGSIAAIVIYMPPERVVAGATVPLELQSSTGALVLFIPEPGAEVETVGSVGDGQVTFEAASTANGAPVVGRFSGTIFEGL